jgi:hypothetical protein
MTPTDQVLAMARAYVEHTRAKRYSHAQYALTRMSEIVADLPDWALPPVVEPAAEVVRDLAGGSTVTLRNDDGNLVLVVRDHDGEVLAPVLTEQEAAQMRADLARVIAAMEVKS